MKPYSLDLREKIVESVCKGVPKAQTTARRFGLDRATLKRYCKLLDERGTLQARKAPAKKPKPDEKAIKLLAKDLQSTDLGPPTPREGRVPVRPLRGEAQRSDALSGSKAPLSRSRKKDPKGHHNERSS